MTPCVDRATFGTDSAAAALSLQSLREDVQVAVPELTSSDSSTLCCALSSARSLGVSLLDLSITDILAVLGPIDHVWRNVSTWLNRIQVLKLSRGIILCLSLGRVSTIGTLSVDLIDKSLDSTATSLREKVSTFSLERVIRLNGGIALMRECECLV